MNALLFWYARNRILLRKATYIPHSLVWGGCFSSVFYHIWEDVEYIQLPDMSDHGVSFHAVTFVYIQIQPSFVLELINNTYDRACTNLFHNWGIVLWVPYNNLDNIILSIAPNENAGGGESSSQIYEKRFAA